jgi:hypothetical protein
MSPAFASRRWLTWRWATLLGFALLAPAALPAGGGDRRLPEVRRRESSREPLLSVASSSLHSSPQRHAPVLAHLEPGSPLRVLRHWFAPDGRRWLQVEAVREVRQPSRGWLPG